MAPRADCDWLQRIAAEEKLGPIVRFDWPGPRVGPYAHGAGEAPARRSHGLFAGLSRNVVVLSAGSALLFDGYLLHRSLPNTGRHGMRRALVNHYMSAESLLPWFRPAEAEPMGTVDHRDVLLIASDDPYEFKGIEDLMHPHVRPGGEGGCLR